MNTYYVNASRWPISEPRFKPGDVFESEFQADAEGARAGFLVLAEVDNPFFTEEMATAVKKYRETKPVAAPEAVEPAPKPQTKEQIAAAEAEARRKADEAEVKRKASVAAILAPKPESKEQSPPEMQPGATDKKSPSPDEPKKAPSAPGGDMMSK